MDRTYCTKNNESELLGRNISNIDQFASKNRWINCLTAIGIVVTILWWYFLVWLIIVFLPSWLAPLIVIVATASLVISFSCLQVRKCHDAV